MTKKSFSIPMMALLLISAPVLAGGVSEHSSAAVKHSGEAAFNLSAAGVKLVSGAVAVPLMVSGQVGKLSGDVGEALWDEATGPLPVTEEVITAVPSPADAMGPGGGE